MEQALGDLKHYVIRGGVAGRERMRLISRVLHAGTEAFCARAGVAAGMRCLDAGCGGGDVTTFLARCVGPRGRVVGIDLDATKLDLARQEAGENGIDNVDFVVADVTGWEGDGVFDAVYARFVLTHLQHPADAIARFRGWLRPGGLLLLEDIDFSGCVVEPESEAHRRYQRLYSEVVARRGGDANIGPRLPGLVARGGFTQVSAGITQPLGLEGEVKVLHAITLENIADAVVDAALASREEVDDLVRQLFAIAADSETLTSTPRIVQVSARRPQ